jgi:hypothetical protein
VQGLPIGSYQSVLTLYFLKSAAKGSFVPSVQIAESVATLSVLALSFVYHIPFFWARDPFPHFCRGPDAAQFLRWTGADPPRSAGIGFSAAMAEGAMPGAPHISGTDDASHFYHQPPPIAGLGIQSAAEQSSGDDSPQAQAAPPTSPQRRPSSAPSGSHQEQSRRARFPDEPNELEKKFSAKHPNDPPYSSGVGLGEGIGEKDRDPERHKGAWESFRGWLSDFKKDYGAPSRRQDLTDLIGKFA